MKLIFANKNKFNLDNLKTIIYETYRTQLSLTDMGLKWRAYTPDLIC